MMAPPPGYVAYGGQGVNPAAFKPIKSISRALMIVQGLGALMSLVVVVMQLGLVSKATDYLDNKITQTELTDALTPFTSVSLFAALISVAVIVLGILWSFRLSSNLVALGRLGVTWKSGLTIVVWILGGCTLNIITFLMLGEHWRASDPSVAPGDGSWKRTKVNPLIIVWFVLGLIGVLVGVASGISSFASVNVNNNTDSLAKSLANHRGLIVAASVLSVSATVVLINVVKQLSDRHMQATREA